jgi:hypothetical protein
MHAFFHQYLTAIGEDTTIIVSINGSKFHHVIMFVNTNFVNPQPIVCLTLPDWHWKNPIMNISGIRSTNIGDEFHVSHVEIGLIILEIRLVVDSSS